MVPLMSRTKLKEHIDAIEEAYEFMLGYAAQGLESDEGSKTGGELRGYLEKANTALQALAPDLRELVETDELEPAERYEAFIEVIEGDAKTAGAAVSLVLAQPSISSQLIDNLNASIHLRALLTDLFLIDEVLNKS